jgi:hypothetical protein
MSNVGLSEIERKHYTQWLIKARRGVGGALRQAHGCQEKEARQRVHRAKLALGERGPPWWTDGAPDYNRHLIKNSPYNEWYSKLPQDKR